MPLFSPRRAVAGVAVQKAKRFIDAILRHDVSIGDTRGTNPSVEKLDGD